jgi:predicted Zn-dependent protease
MTTDVAVTIEAKASRMERLCLALALAAVAWAIVSVILWVRRPSALEIAHGAIAEGQLPLAVDGYLLHLAGHPQDWQARLELAAVLEGIDPTQSLMELRKIPADADEHGEALRLVARICLARGRDGEAKEALLALETRAPDDAWVQFSLAQIFHRQRETTLALRHAQRAVQLDPSQSGHHFLLAELFDDLDRHADMIPPLLAVLDREPENYAAHLNLCYAYGKTGQPGEARREAVWCLTRNPKDVHARRWLAAAARDQGRPEEAKAEIRKALELAPEDLNCRLLEAELLLFERKGDVAYQRLSPLLERYPDELRLVSLLAQAAAAAGRSEEAEKLRQKVQQIRRARQRKP